MPHNVHQCRGAPRHSARGDGISLRKFQTQQVLHPVHAAGSGNRDLETGRIATTINLKKWVPILQKQAEKCIKAIPCSAPANTSGPIWEIRPTHIPDSLALSRIPKKRAAPFDTAPSCIIKHRYASIAIHTFMVWLAPASDHRRIRDVHRTSIKCPGS